MDGLMDRFRAGNGPGSVQKRSVQITFVFLYRWSLAIISGSYMSKLQSCDIIKII